MPIRNRSMRKEFSGKYYTLSGVEMISSEPVVIKSCTDYIGSYGQDHDFLLSSSQVSGAVINQWRVAGTGGLALTINKCQAAGFDAAAPDESHIPMSGVDLDQVNRALAITNPSRPEVLLPAFLGELRDLPGMVKHGMEVCDYITRIAKGNLRTTPEKLTDLIARRKDTPHRNWSGKPNVPLSRAKQLAIANLALQFGWLPFIGDVSKMISLMDSIERRRTELNKLHLGEGLKRRIQLDAVSDVLPDYVRTIDSVNGSGSGIGVKSVEISTRREAKRWAVVRWKPDSLSSLPPTDENIRQMLLGVTLGSVPSVAWELLPWSWLADYFGNVGQTLTALGNHAGTQPPKGCVMSHYTVTQEFPSKSGGTGNYRWTISSGRRVSETKRRTVFSGVQLPHFRIPILGTRQLSILGSIYATRAIR